MCDALARNKVSGIFEDAFMGALRKDRSDGVHPLVRSRMTPGTYGTISSFNPLRNNIGIVVILGNVSSLGQI